MPRKPRLLSSTNIYHVIIRGVNHQVIFETSKDYIKYLDLLEYFKGICKFDLYAYCLMSNHVHLIIKCNDIPLDIIFKKLNTTYAMWFNMKYQRVGHLQQGRFLSEPINDSSYLLTAIRYIHFNPTKAGLESHPGESYLWSSVFEYASERQRLVDTDFIFNIISPQNFRYFMNISNDDKLMDIDNISVRLPDDVAQNIILEISHCNNSAEFQKLPTIKRNKYIIDIHNRGVSIRQINRLTGVSKGVIARITNVAKETSNRVDKKVDKGTVPGEQGK